MSCIPEWPGVALWIWDWLTFCLGQLCDVQSSGPASTASRFPPQFPQYLNRFLKSLQENSSLPPTRWPNFAFLTRANGGNYKDSKEQFYNGMAMASSYNKLPANFADKVLQLQSLLDDSLSMDLITDLNELYRIGIDYYIQYEPRRAQHFQKKMTKLLADPATLNLIESKSKISHIRSPQFATKSKISSQVARFKNCSSEYVRNIMEQSDKAIKKHEIIRNKDLNKQEEELQNRIMLKKYKSQEKLMKFNDVK